MRRRTTLLLGSLVLLLSSCTSLQEAAGKSTATSSRPAVASATLARLVDPPPTSCPPGPPPKVVSPDYGLAVGQAPAWAVGFSSGKHGPVLLFEGLTRLGPHGFYEKVLWVIQPGYSHVVHLTGSYGSSGPALWFQIGDSAPTTNAALEPASPGAYPVNPAEPNQAFINFPSYLFIPQAGCYSLEAAWPDGHWRTAFAAGGG
jgi:hypothetical protein